MATYMMFGKYSQKALGGIGADRTDKAEKIIKKAGGKIISMYALLGVEDLVLIVDLPDTKAAMKVSVAISKLTGIGFSTAPAVPVKEFDKLVG